MLTPVLRKRYDEHGFVLTPQMWTDSLLHDLNAEVRRIYSEEIIILSRLEGEAKELNRRRFFVHDLRLKSLLFSNFVRSRPFAHICAQLLGQDVDTHYDGAIVKCSYDGHSIDWHQNEGLNVFGIKKHLTCFTAITKMSEETGCLWMIPGSHHLGKLPHEPSPVTGFQETRADKSGAIPVEMSPGQILVIHPLTLHMSGENRSSDLRIGYVPVFQASQLVLRNGQPLKTTPILRGGNVCLV